MRIAAAYRRHYHSPIREERAARTRAAVLATATRLFRERGWAATGMRDIAHAAGVAVETVYASFPSKADLLVTALEEALVGDSSAVPLTQRPEFAALGEGARPARVAMAASLLTDVHHRTAALYLALRQAAPGNRSLAEHLVICDARRRQNIEHGLTFVKGAALTGEERDGLTAVLDVDVYQQLVVGCGWTQREYEFWVAGVIDKLLGH
ncbi:TetR/AcrR family transcriptional regulator [Dactylosporangium sp. NPDC048998]|uniref:TetR/AcrR family transcriptional regulator n=1 Tax=Dactylosporangium sp. NPDC048998 TaxID=3363976 RepID=UPI0037118BD6